MRRQLQRRPLAAPASVAADFPRHELRLPKSGRAVAETAGGAPAMVSAIARRVIERYPPEKREACNTNPLPEMSTWRARFAPRR
jgi:hypothetical protein